MIQVEKVEHIMKGIITLLSILALLLHHEYNNDSFKYS